VLYRTLHDEPPPRRRGLRAAPGEIQVGRPSNRDLRAALTTGLAYDPKRRLTLPGPLATFEDLMDD
jgi:hypothetical protein